MSYDGKYWEIYKDIESIIDFHEDGTPEPILTTSKSIIESRASSIKEKLKMAKIDNFKYK